MVGENSCEEVEGQKNITQKRNKQTNFKNLDNEQEAPSLSARVSHPGWGGGTLQPVTSTMKNPKAVCQLPLIASWLMKGTYNQKELGKSF